MERADELALGDRLARLDGHLYGAGRAPVTVDVAVYTDPARHAAEVAALRRSPQVAVPAAAVAEPGSFATVDLLGTPLIVSRDDQGAVHALVNACAHRGATVRHEPCGRARVHACRFHGWSYHLDGRLRSVAEPDRFGPAPDVAGLARVPCAERHGLVWVAPDAPAGPLDLRSWLTAALDDRFAALGLDRMVAHRSATYPVACNWKMITDGFLETYHIKYLHRGSVAPYVPSNRAMIDRYGPHFVAYLPKNRLLRQLAERPRDEWAVLDHLTMSATLVPGTVVQWNAGHVELFAIRPALDDPTRCAVDVTLLVPAERADEHELWDRNWERLIATIPAEDFAAAAETQANIGAGAVRRLHLGAVERAIVEHLAAVDAQLG